MATGDQSKKRKQRYLPQNRPAKKKGAYPLKPGVQGFFISCDGGREFQASQEAINVIDSELMHGTGLKISSSGMLENPVNKKVTFHYSEDEDEDVEEDEGNNGEEEGTKGAVDEPEVSEGGNNGQEEEHKEVGDKTELSEGGGGKTEVSEGGNNGEEEEHKEVGDKTEVSEGGGDKTEVSEGGGDKTEVSEGGSNQVNEKETASEGSCEIKLLAETKTEKNQEDEVKEKNDVEEPPRKKACTEEADASTRVNAEKSIDKLIEAELKELGDKSKRRFMKLHPGCNGIAFIQMKRKDGDPSPKDIVQHGMTSAAATKKHMSRFILRLIPIEVSCYPSEEEISRAIKPLVEQYFPVETDKPRKFAVLYGARANTGVDRMKIINTVAKSIPAPHKVDLSNPEMSIVVEIVKTVCLIGVVEKYKELAKYNLRQLTSTK